MYAALHMSVRNEASFQALAHLAVLIPAWQPLPQLLALAEDLVTQGFGVVLVVNDGSDLQHLPLFEAVAQLPRVRVLTHAANPVLLEAGRKNSKQFFCSSNCFRCVSIQQGKQSLCQPCEIPLCAISRVLKTSGGARLRFICKDFRVTEFGIATVNSALACR